MAYNFSDAEPIRVECDRCERKLKHTSWVPRENRLCVRSGDHTKLHQCWAAWHGKTERRANVDYFDSLPHLTIGGYYD